MPFPLILGSHHELAGKDHHAAVDAQQESYLTKVYLMLYKYSADRPEGLASIPAAAKGASWAGSSEQLSPASRWLIAICRKLALAWV